MDKQKELFEKATAVQFSAERFLLGPWTSYSLYTDPKHAVFVLSRYKFASKMCTQGNTLEIGCGDAFGVPILAQVSKSYLGVDVDERLITDNEDRFKNFPNVAFRLVNSNNRVQGKFDNVIHIDVLEHLDKTHERQFLEESIEFLDAEGIYICGTPNMEAEEYASEQSKIQHINLKNANQLKELFLEYFHWVFIFSMNDEVVHTGFHPMAHYLFAVCVGKK